MINVLRSLPGTVWILGMVSLLNDAASELVYALLPLYLATVLASGPRALGLIEGAAEAASALLKLASGVWYDRGGRARPFIVVGYGLSALSRPLLALVVFWPFLLVLRVADRIGKGLRTSPRDALIAGAVDPAHRGLAFGVHRAMDNAGAVIGPLIAAGLLAAGIAIREILLWAVIPGALCVLLAALVREAPRVMVERVELHSSALRELPPVFGRLLVCVGIFTLGAASNAFLLLRAAETGMPPAQVALMWSAVAASATLFAVPLAHWSDRVGRIRLIVAGWLLYAALQLVFGAVASAAWFWPLAILFGVYLAATEGAERALIADVVPAERRGAAYGWYYLVKGLLLLPASAVFGLLWQAYGALAAFGFSAGCVLIATGLLWAKVARR